MITMRGHRAAASFSSFLGAGPQARTATRKHCVLPGTNMNARAATIYGGTTQVQKNILAKAVLDLPNA